MSAGDGVPMRRSTRFVARLAWTAAVAVAVEVPAPPLHIIDAEGAVTAASRPGGRSPGGAADAVGRREETAVVDFGQVESDATGHGLAAGTLARWATRGSELSAMSRRTAVERGRRKGPSLSSEIRRR